MSERPADATAPVAAPAAARFGLVRPLQGRYVAGVSGALARATGTDPVLWRVVLAVLVCFGGIGAVLYAVVWLLTPEEGDTGSPVEALLGRGLSSTSPVTVAVLSAISVFLLIFILPRPLYLLLLGGTVVLALLLMSQRSGQEARPATPAPAPEPAREPAREPAKLSAPAEAPAAQVSEAGEATGHRAPSTAGEHGRPPTVSQPAPAPGTPTGGADTSYRPPFAPHGPFAGPAPSPPRPPVPPRPPRPRQRTVLPAVTFFAGLAVLGTLGVLDVSGALDVPAPGYVAAALAVVGVGLLAGAWLGGARPLIAFGVVIALALPLAHAVDTWEPPPGTGDVTWTPTTVAELQEEYEVSFGSGLLDLRGVDMSGQEITITARVSFGELRIILPEDAAVEAVVTTRLGGATVLGTSIHGFTQDTVRDPGNDDPGDGTLRLNANVRLGGLEVHR